MVLESTSMWNNYFISCQSSSNTWIHHRSGKLETNLMVFKVVALITLILDITTLV